MSAFTQDLMAIGIGLLAALYLAHRWWPGLKGLVQNTPGTQACGQTQGESTSPSAAQCGAGCGQCGQATPKTAKDHRIHVVKRIG